MSKQALNLQNNWQEVKKEFRKHFNKSEDEESDEKVRYNSEGRIYPGENKWRIFQDQCHSTATRR